jgi:membrane-bound lytic murein transglycosylase MltF
MRIALVLALVAAAVAVGFLLFSFREEAPAPASVDVAAEPPPRELPDEPPLADPELESAFGDLDEIRDRGVLRALVTPSRTDFFLVDGEIRGVQAEFLYRFVEWLDEDRASGPPLRLKFVPVPFRDLLPALEDGRGDLVAAFLAPTEERADRIDVAADFRLSANEIVVTHADAEVPDSLEGLAGRTIVVLEGSSYHEHLLELSARLVAQGLEPIDVRTADGRLYTEDILELVNAGAVEMTVADDYKAELWARVLPDIRLHDYLAVTQDNPLGWGLRPDAPQFRAALEAFSREVRQGSLIGNILFTRYFESEEFIDNPLQRAERDRLEELLPLFSRYGEEYGIDPLALAAQAYQESRFDHEAVSHVGAVGIMQLLPATASDPNVGIDDIDDLDANVHAGARYLAFLRDRYFDDPDLGPWDRRAFAWAAYNAGPRAIARARSRAESMGLDRNAWFGETELAVSRMIGSEPVRYVANIQKYYLAYQLARDEEAARAARIQEVATDL